MMKKKLIASLTSFALIFTTVCCGISVPVSATETAGSNPPEINDVTYEFYRDPETGHIAIEEPTVYSRKSDSGEADSGIAPNGAIPSKYPNVSNPISYMYSYYPQTRSQSPYGTCWAHAATATAEFDMVENHYYNKSTDLSELQLAWYHYHDDTTLPGLDGDGVYIPASAKHYLDVGGNIHYSVHTLSQWKNYSNESSLPYTSVVNNKSYNVSGNAANHDAAQFRSIRYLNIKSNPDSVKQAILDQGAVYISYNSKSENYYNFKYSNGSIQTYYNNSSDTITNHDIVIVGWDDSINAWLARNSWSTDTNVNGSKNTYFWLYYYDKSLSSTAYALDFEPGSTSDNLYQYDGSTTHATIKTKSAANIFKANSNGSYLERLDSVMVSFTTVANVRYKVQIYKNPSTSKPTSGVLQSSSTTTGSTTSKGIYTIDLKKPVYLNPGEKFAVVVTTLNSSGTPTKGTFEIESGKNVTYTQNGTTYKWFNSYAHADAGESFIDSNGSWYDVTGYGSGYGNMRIKAITSDTSIRYYNINYQLNGGTNNTSNPTSFRSDTSGTFTLKSPTRSGYHFLGWYSDSEFKNKVTSINYNNKSNQTYYAKWCSNSNPETIKSVIKVATTSSDGKYQGKCLSCGLDRGTLTLYRISSIGLSSTREAYPGGSNSPVPVVKDRAGNLLTPGKDYTYTYNKSTRQNIGRYSVTIKFNGTTGKYSAKNVTKYYAVVPNAPTSVSADLYGYDDVKVTWSSCYGASGYNVYYKKASSSKYVFYKRTSKNYMKIPNRSDNVTYNFKVVPYYKYGKTRYESLSYRETYTTTLKKMAQPSMYKTTDGGVQLTWTPISAASGYQVYWSTSKKGKYNKLCDYSSKYIGVTFTVGKNKTYYYKVRAYKTVGSKKIYGPYSTPKAFKLK